MRNIERDMFLASKLDYREVGYYKRESISTTKYVKCEKDDFTEDYPQWKAYPYYIGDPEQPDFKSIYLVPNFSTPTGFFILLDWFKKQNPYFIGAVLDQDVKNNPLSAIGLNTLSPSYQSIFLKDLDPDKFADAVYKILVLPEDVLQTTTDKWIEACSKY